VRHVELCPVEDKDKAVAAVEDPAPFVELHGKKRRRETEQDHGEYIVVLQLGRRWRVIDLRVQQGIGGGSWMTWCGSGPK
jgi:hypothetical protein